MQRDDNGQRATSVGLRQVNIEVSRLAANLHRSALQHWRCWATKKIGDALNHLFLVALRVGAKVATVTGNLYHLKSILLSEYAIGLRVHSHIALKHDGKHLGARQRF